MVFHQMIQIMMRNLWPTQKDPYANDPNHDEKSPADVKRPLCKYDLDCQSHMSFIFLKGVHVTLFPPPLKPP
jgi:hypothetical protein